ncbi:DUF1858 domain-containing protein [Alsobacter sp. R-9]
MIPEWRSIMITITSDLLVNDLMTRWPATIRVFLDYKFLCIGCPFGDYHSIEYACEEHNVSTELFVTDLLKLLNGAIDSNNIK